MSRHVPRIRTVSTRKGKQPRQMGMRTCLFSLQEPSSEALVPLKQILDENGKLTKKVDHQRAVKIYERGQGDKIIPSDLRPAPVLKARHFLSCLLLKLKFNVAAHVGLPFLRFNPSRRI